jgi:hypothetical protein
MKDPQRLLDEGATELELALLRAGDAEGPSPAARRAAAASLGLSVALTSSTALATKAGVPTLAPAGKLLATKWWLITVLGVGAGTALIVSAPRDPLPHAAPARALAAPVRTATQPPVEDRADALVLPPQPAPSASVERAKMAAARGSVAAASGIQEQVLLIDRARNAAVLGKPAAALSALDEYQRRFPRGILKQEAAMLRIEAALALGDKATAERVGRAFLEQYPQSALAGRVRSLLHD